MAKMRDLVLSSGTWAFAVGSQHVKLRSPEGKSWVLGCGELLGVTDWDEGGYGIGPGDVRRYVEHELLGIPRPPSPPAQSREETLTETLLLFFEYARLQRQARLDPGHEARQQDVRDFERKHEAVLEPHWRAWQAADERR